MSEILIVKSLDGQILTGQSIARCLDSNETLITKRIFSPNRSSMEITFVDEESTSNDEKITLLTRSMFDLISKEPR
jgi:hypothetical protein